MLLLETMYTNRSRKNVLPLRKKLDDFYYSLLVFSHIPNFQIIQQNHNLSKTLIEVINTA